MNRKGWEMGIATIIVFVLGVALLLIAVMMMTNNKKTANENLDALQQCGGLIGSLGGSKSQDRPGGCFYDKACRRGVPDDGVGTVDGSGAQAESGYYFQYIGEGWGCDPTKDKNPANDDDTWYCCIQMPQNANPLRASDINRAKCISDLKEGEWAVQTGLECKIVGQGYSLTAASNEDITFIYKPKGTDEKCQVRMDLPGLPTDEALKNDDCYYSRNSDGVVTFTKSPLAVMQKAYADNPDGRIDLSHLNKQQTFTVQLKSGVGALLTSPSSFSLTTTNPGIYYCSASKSHPRCVNQPFNKDLSPNLPGFCKPVQGDRCEYVQK